MLIRTIIIFSLEMSPNNPLLSILLLLIIFLHAQDAPNQIPKSGNNQSQAGNYIEFIKGDMPLIVSIGHGGYLMPAEVPERICTDCAKNQDIYTLEIGLMLMDSIQKLTGRKPYVIINHLHRTRLDPNRNIIEAASGNEIAEEAWRRFHGFIEEARNEIQKIYGKGLYIDLHGHRHEIKRTEIGYLLSDLELQLEDDLLNDEAFAAYSSISNLARNNLNNLSFTALLRGPLSLGSMLEDMDYPSVPSARAPWPNPGEPFFSGGYNTMRHGSSSGGTVDGIQIELDLELRSDTNRRAKLAANMAFALVRFLKTHYFTIIPEHTNPVKHSEPTWR